MTMHYGIRQLQASCGSLAQHAAAALGHSAVIKIRTTRQESSDRENEGNEMETRMRYSVAAFAAVLTALSVISPALAQTSPGAALHLAQSRMPEQEQDPDMEMRMPMPGVGGALGVKGCWRSKQTLYGKYRVSFCLERGVDGAYRVDGGGLTCRGDLDWSQDGRKVEIRFNRGRCNRNTDWSRDRISCRVDDGRAQGTGIPVLEPAQARMPTPGGGRDARRMDCIYRPSTGPQSPERFNARRTD